MPKSTTTRTVTTMVVVKEPRKFPTKVVAQVSGIALLLGIAYAAGGK